MVGCVGWMAYSLQLWGRRGTVWRKPFFIWHFDIPAKLLRSKHGNLHRFLKYVHISEICRDNIPGSVIISKDGPYQVF